MSRIKDYRKDKESVIDSGSMSDLDQERIRQDQAIMEELMAILSGIGLDKLVFIK